MLPNFQNLIIDRKGRLGLILGKILKTKWPPAAILFDKNRFPDEKSKTNQHNVTKLSEFDNWPERKVGINLGQNPKNKMAASSHFV